MSCTVAISTLLPPDPLADQIDELEEDMDYDRCASGNPRHKGETRVRRTLAVRHVARDRTLRHVDTEQANRLPAPVPAVGLPLRVIHRLVEQLARRGTRGYGYGRAALVIGWIARAGGRSGRV